MKQETGQCIKCGKETPDRNLFSDAPDDGGYYDWCHDKCYAELLEKYESYPKIQN